MKNDHKEFDIKIYAYSMQQAGFTKEQAQIQAEAISKIVDGKMTTKQAVFETIFKGLTLFVSYVGAIVVAMAAFTWILHFFKH
jgi:hypothetical protein